MDNCLVCKTNKANKKGSHIVPHFLMKRINNQEGEEGRDKELGFTIDKNKTVSYFGRSVLPEKLEEIYGEEYEDIIESNKVSGIVDNYFCSVCEKKLAVIENEYAKTLQETPLFDQNSNCSVDGFICFIFWSSIIWRLSVEEGSGFKLKRKEENKLGRILSKYLKENIQDVEPDVNDLDLKDIGYKLLRSTNFSDQNPTVMNWLPHFERPYTLMIDEYIIFYYFKKSHLKGMVLNYFDSQEFKVKANFNDAFSKESIYGVKIKDYEDIIRKAMRFLAVKKRETLESKLDLLHQKITGKREKMEIALKNEISKRIAFNDEKLGRAHTLENQINIITKTIIEFYNIQN